MSWVYEISQHGMWYRDTDLRVQLMAQDGLYSGAFGVWQDNPACCGDKDLGPIFPGNWTMIELILNHPEMGEYVIRLEPDDATRAAIIAAGREPDNSFYIHGERIPPAVPGYASKGCLIAPRTTRESLWNSPDHSLEVVAFRLTA